MIGTFVVSHASELGLLFGFNTAASEVTFANTFRDAYINFINELNPGCESFHFVVHGFSDQSNSLLAEV